MFDVQHIKKVYFIGIGGIGMSALARYFRFHGKEVSGYDRTPTTLTRQLENEGITVHYEEDLGQAPKDAELVVFTPAVPAEHKELSYYRQNGYLIAKRSEVLGAITYSSFNICVAGTHGKTTITTMIAHILRHSGYGCNAFLGGIAVNYDSNYWSDKRNVCVVEADEYDRSFLRLSPDIAVITAMDADHLDIYGTAEAVEQAFVEFSGRVKPGGLLVSKWGLEKNDELKAGIHRTYGMKKETINTGLQSPDQTTAGRPDILSSNIRVERGHYVFRVQAGEWILDEVELNMGGLHNVENATAAIGIAHQLDINDEKIKAAIASFQGVRRRFEFIIRTDSLVYIDDYAHHPEELRALIEGVRSLFGQRKCTMIFQPHLFTRTRDFADGFAESLDLADEVFLLPIYPARELPIPGVSSELIAEKMEKGKATVVDKDEMMRMLIHMKGYGDELEILVTAGAGDIDMMVGRIEELLV
jgi:UDP-N-acetylmuramate--alanine ligase